ncbi:hypothetical protein MTO96_028419 [Rhipicephalus appendiculatus]
MLPLLLATVQERKEKTELCLTDAPNRIKKELQHTDGRTCGQGIDIGDRADGAWGKGRLGRDTEAVGKGGREGRSGQEGGGVKEWPQRDEKKAFGVVWKKRDENDAITARKSRIARELGLRRALCLHRLLAHRQLGGDAPRCWQWKPRLTEKPLSSTPNRLRRALWLPAAEAADALKCSGDPGDRTKWNTTTKRFTD